MTPEQDAYYDSRLSKMLGRAGVRERACYRVKDVAAALGVSVMTVRSMCDRWEPSATENGRHDGLECYVFNCSANGPSSKVERRIPHHALVEYLYRSNLYEQQCG